MEKRLQTRITLQPFHTINSFHLTNLPTGNLQNPGIGLKLFDVMLPLYGVEKFENKKEDNVITGSFNDTTEKSIINQEGFGSNSTQNISNINSPSQITKLGPIFEAMQKATINTKKFLYKPPKSDQKRGKKQSINLVWCKQRL